jgi:hypothetical protein
MGEMVSDHEAVLYGADDTDALGLIDRVSEVEKTHKYVEEIRNRMRQIVWAVILLIVSTFAIDWYKGTPAPSVDEIAQGVAKALKEKK